jgi:CubicO group peptidase (beta-lactamase class C family)
MSAFEAGRCTAALALSAAIAVLANGAFAQEAKPAPAPLEQRVDAFVAAIEAKRKELGVVGAAIVVAHGDRIVRLAGLGQRSTDQPAPVTEDTVFQIASVTKQFTAIAVALAVGEGKMAFEDHPRRFVPSFKLKDPDADASLNIIDLLAHRSGVGRSDLTWLYAPFTQAELFELAYRAKPAAKLREQQIYSNTMFSLAGAALAGAYGTSYEVFMRERIFKPLGMASTTITFAELQASPNRASGYLAPAAGAIKPAKPADTTAIAPAGAINSTARDMGAWIKFLNARGQAEGLKIAPAAYARVFENHLKAGQGMYGLGIQLETRAGLLLAEHGGNLPGFTAQVVHVPDRALSLALLTNQNESALAALAKELFWEIVVQPELPAAATPKAEPAPAPAPPAAGPPIAPELMVGTYFFAKGGVELRKIDTGLIMILPGAPPLPLANAGVNTYELVGAGGIVVHVAASQTMPGRIALTLVLPPSHGSARVGLIKKDAAWLARVRAEYKGSNAVLVGSYVTADRKTTREIVPHKDGLALNDGEQLRALVEAGADLFRLEGEPTHRMQIKRAGDRVTGITLDEAGSNTELITEGSVGTGDAERARAILERAVTAAGGAEALDRITSYAARGRASVPSQGIDGPVEDLIVPGKRAMHGALGAFGKFMRYHSVSNEQRGVWAWVDGEPRQVTGKALESARIHAVPHPLYRWKERFPDVAAVGEAVVNGETALVVEMTPRGLAPDKLYISAASGLVLRLEMAGYLGDSLFGSIISDFSDYREVKGARLPFAITTPMAVVGDLVYTFDSVILDEPIDPTKFETK